MVLTGKITTDESGVDLLVEWQIPRFSTLWMDDGVWYWSPDFCFGGERWFLGIYPNGSSWSDTSGHVDLGLFKYHSGRSIGVSLSLSLKTAKGGRHREEHYTKEFDDGVNCFHSFYRFVPRTELTTLRCDLLPDDVLTVVCIMKGRSSAGSENNDPGNANVRTSSQRLRTSAQRVRASTQCVRASTQRVRASTQRVRASTQTVEEKLELLEATSQIDKLKLNYEQALQDKVEAEKKLGFLTNVFKEKERDLQRQLSAKEDEVNSAKKRIMLIEQENASYKSQNARLKQEMEEKDITLRNQIAEQAKKADESRVAACAAERNLENREQEVTQLRQRLTLLEREKENLTNAARDEIKRPVPRTCVKACTQTVEERSCVEACTQTVEERSCVEACTQTVEERLEYEPECAYVEACTQTLEEDFSINNPTEDYGFVTGINHLLKENTGVDVTFELETPKGKTKILAHQLILSAMSPYFADKFYNKERNDGHQVIPLQAVKPKAFEKMIRYCYGEKPTLKTIKDACALFKVASEFKVISLRNVCHSFFRHTKIEPGNVFTILKISMEMEDKNLQEVCYKILQEKTREVMAAYELCDVTPAMVYTLLNLPKLSLNSEYELIKWVFDWANVKSQDKNSSCRSSRDYLANLLHNMNFLTLTAKEFAMLIKDNPNFFDSDEIASISMNIVLPGTREMPAWHNKNLKGRIYTGSNESD